MSGRIMAAGVIRATLLSGLLKLTEVSGDPAVRQLTSPPLNLLTSIYSETFRGITCLH